VGRKAMQRELYDFAKARRLLPDESTSPEPLSGP